MISKKALLPRVMRTKKAILVFKKLGDKPWAMLYRFIPVPGHSDQRRNYEKQNGVVPFEKKPEVVINKINSQNEQKNHQCYLAFC